MYRSKNCGHGFDLYIKGTVYNGNIKGIVTGGYIEYKPVYCPICGKKVEEVEND